MSTWPHPRLDETLELDLDQPRQRLIGSLTSPLTVDQAFMQYIPDPSPIQKTSTPWTPDLYTGGLDRLRKCAEASNVGEGGQESEEETTTELPREVLLKPSRLSNPSIPEVPPLPQTLPPRSVSRSRSGSKNIVTPPVPQLKRAVTMRSTSSRSSITEGARPKSSHSDADLTEREIYPRTSGFELGSNLGRIDGTTQRVSDTAPMLPSRLRTPSKSSMRKLSSSSHSATPIGEARQNSGGPQVWESAFQGVEDTEVALARPRAPTPSAMTPAMPFTPDSNQPPSSYSTTPINPPFQLASQSQLTARHTRSTSASRSRSRSVSAGPPGTPPPPPPVPPTSIPDDYIAEPFPLPPTTPPRSFSRPPKSTSSAYVDPTGFPVPPAYPPVPSLVASGSTSTSTRSSAYTSPGASHPLSSSDLSALGIGLGQVVNHEDETHMLYGEEDVSKLSGGLPKTMSYTSRDHSESSIARLQFATNAAALSAGNGNAGIIPHRWTEPYASSMQGGSGLEGSPGPLSRIDPPKKMANAVWRSVNEDEDFEPDMDPDDAELPAAASNFTYQRSRNGTVASSSSASVSGLTSASEDETDADDYSFLKEVVELDEDVRTAAVVVAEEGRGLIVHGEGMDISSVTIQPGTTHLLLSSSSSPHSIPSLLTQSLPNISTTLLALDISANFLSALPPTLAACTQLTELNIANNPLRALPVWLSGLERLHVLIADSTGISSLPLELASLKALTILSIRRNKLVSLPPWLSYLPVLERLEVEGNPFQGPWKALLAPLMSGRQPAPSISGSVQQQSSISSSSSHSDLNSMYGPGLSMYGESVFSNPPPTPSSANVQMQQGSFANGDPLSPKTESNGRKLLSEEEDYTIMPSRPVGQTLKSPVPLLPTSTQLTVPPLSPGPPTGASTKSFTSSINSPSQLPYMGDSPTSPTPEDRRGSFLQRAPTFSVAERRTPSPYLRPLSRTLTTPSRSRTSAGSANGSIATFIAEQDHGGMRSRTSSAASQRPHTDYVSTRYDKSSTVEDSGYYGSVTEYSAFRNSAGSEWLSFDVIKEDERKKELRRMRSADELRRALESVIGPSEPLAPQEDENGGEITETDHRSAFHVPNVPRIDMRPSMKQSYTASDAETVSPSRGVALQDRPVAKRFASLGMNAGLGGQATRVRPPLSESMWDGGVDADAEPDDEMDKSRAASPTRQVEEVRRPKTSRKWGFLKKMSMGRMRPEPSAPKAAAPLSQSTQTSPQGSNGKRIAISVSSVGNGVSPTSKPHQPSRESGLMHPSPNLSSVPSHLTPSSSLRSLAAPSSSLSIPAHIRTARRRSFLPLDGPPALNIPIPRTSPFMPEALIPAESEEELQSAITDASRSPDSPLPPVPAPSQGTSAEFYNSDSRALRSVMAYLRDMADLGMANSAIPPLLPTAALPGNSAQQENIETRSRRPTVVENGRMLSEASLTSSSSSGPTTANTSLRSDEQHSNTMSVVTSESGGSGKGDEERKCKNDKSKRALLVKEIIETERTYVQGLQELLDIYIKPASQPLNTLGNAVASTKETIIPAQERKIAFNGVDALFSFHHQVFLPALEQAARPLLLSRPDADASGELSTTVAEAVAMVFVSHAAFMRMYSTYINNFDNAVQRLKHWSHDQRKTGVLSPSSSTAHLAGIALQQMAVAGASSPNEVIPISGVQSLTSSQRKRIRQFLKRSRLNAKHSQINLEAYLLLPVQRIPRYRLLLEELVRCTPPKPDLLDDPLDRALNEIQSLATNMNEGKRESESRRRLVQWQSRIKGKFPSPLVQPHRRLIMDGVLNLTRVVRKSSVSFEVINPDGNKSNVQVECLAPEENPKSLVGVLCNDLLVLCKDPSNGQDKSGPVDLWAVLRMQTLPQPASIIPGGALRVVDNKAILYFTTPSTSEALTWCRAINMHMPVSKP